MIDTTVRTEENVVVDLDCAWKCTLPKSLRPREWNRNVLGKWIAIEGPVRCKIVAHDKADVSEVAELVTFGRSDDGECHVCISYYEMDPRSAIAVANKLCMVSGMHCDQIVGLSDADRRKLLDGGQIALQVGKIVGGDVAIEIRRGFEHKSDWAVYYMIDVREPPSPRAR